MNYFLKKLGYKQDPLCIGLHRLNVSLICWLWMCVFVVYHIYVPRIYHGFFNLLLWACGISIAIYLSFTLLLWIISVSRYGFRSASSLQQHYVSKKSINYFAFFTFKQEEGKKDRLSFSLQVIGIVCALLFFVPLTAFGLLFCYNCFGENWDGMSQEEIDKFIVARNDIGFGFPREEFLRMLFSITICSIFIYLSFGMLAWIISGFLSGNKRKGQFVPLLSVNSFDDYIRYVQINFKILNCKVILSDQRTVMIEIQDAEQDVILIQIMAKNIIYLSGMTEWHCDTSTEYSMKANDKIDGDVVRSISFYKGDGEVFSIQARMFFIDFYAQDVFAKNNLAIKQSLIT